MVDLKQIMKSDMNKNVVTSVRLTEDDKKFICKNNISLSELVKKTLEELKKEAK